MGEVGLMVVQPPVTSAADPPKKDWMKKSHQYLPRFVFRDLFFAVVHLACP